MTRQQAYELLTDITTDDKRMDDFFDDQEQEAFIAAVNFLMGHQWDVDDHEIRTF